MGKYIFDRQKYLNNQRFGKAPIILKVTDNDLKAIQATHLVYRVTLEGKIKGYFKTCEKIGKKDDLSDAYRKIAYEELAALFGLREFIPHTSICILKTETKELLDSFQIPTKGIDIWFIPSEERIKKITPVFYMNLTKMCLFDSLCHELDHSLNNYHPVMNEEKVFYTVSMFDNGSGGTFGSTSRLTDKTYYGVDSMFSLSGHFTTPYHDKRLIEQICTISYWNVFSVLHSYVRLRSVLFTLIRIHKIRKAVKCDSSSGFLQLLEPSQWNKKMIDDDLSGKYGNTNLYSLVHDWGGDGIKHYEGK